MKIQKGDTVNLTSRKVRVGVLMAKGEDSDVWNCTDLKSRERGVLKIFTNRMSVTDRLRRVKYLVGAQLQKSCASLQPPTDWFQEGGLVGHFTPLVEGRSLEDYIESAGNSLMENHKLAIAIAQAICTMHDLDIVHGDLHLRQFLVIITPTGPELIAIDFDNFWRADLPKPPLVGNLEFMSSEHWEAYLSKKEAIQTKKSDEYSLAVLIHRVLLCNHPAGQDPNQLAPTMRAGVWAQDPARNPSHSEGFPSKILNSDLMRMFRLGLSRTPADRPSAREWVKVLHKTLFQIHVHDECGGPVYVDPSKTRCPFCGGTYNSLKLRFTSNRQIPILSAAIPIGRAQLQSPKVSEKHAVCRKIGPETWLESAGRNGTFRWSGSDWVRLPDNTPVLLQRNDRLRIADVDCTVEECRD